MMRYVLTDATQEKVSIEKEMDYLKSYIELQQLRFGKNVEVNFRINGSSFGKSMAPLIFIPFIENAFKYGVNPEEKCSIQIEVDIEAHEIHLLVTNRKVKIASAEKTGLGIDNARKRLELLYPGKHLFTIQEDTEKYSVSILIIIT